MACWKCREVVSLTSGTAFAGEGKPLRFWLEAMWVVAGSDSALDSRAIAAALRVGPSVDVTAYLERLRRAFRPQGSAELAGAVEIGRSFVCVAAPSHDAVESVEIAIAVEIDEKRGEPARMRAGELRGEPAHALASFVGDTVVLGSRLRTAAPGGSTHVSRVARLLDGHLQAALAVTRRQLPYALDAFAFHFEQPRTQPQGARFLDLVTRAMGEARVDVRPVRSRSGVRSRSEAGLDELPAAAAGGDGPKR